MRNWRRIAAMLLAGVAVGIGAVAAGASSTTTPSGSYKGKTNNGLPVAFKIKNGKVHNFSATVHALCISVASGSSYLDPVLHQITPPPMALARNGRFNGKYVPGISSTHGTIDGRVTGKAANGTYKMSYSATRGLTLYACQEKGTWKATRK